MGVSRREGRWWCCVLILSVLCMVRAETIHFTNSPKLILGSKNYTTYELEVPGSKPITIIEATDPVQRVDTERLDTLPDDPQQVRIRGPAPTTSFRTSTGISVSRPSAQQDEGSPRKTLYSPELLDKFLKEYSEKLRNADSLTRKRLNEITMANSMMNHQHGDDEGEDEQDQPYQQRGKWPEGQQRAKNQSSVEVSPASATPSDGAKVEDEFVFEDTHERHVAMASAGSSNKRWYQEPPAGGPYPAPYRGDAGQKNHPWNVKDGWVTLEAVPWSESKVSKWHAAGAASDTNRKPVAPGRGQLPQHQTLGNYWSDESDEEPTKYRPAAPSPSSIGASSYYQDGTVGVDEERPYASGNRQPAHRLPSPGESLYNRRRPPYGNERPDDDRGSRPSPHADGWYENQLQSNGYDALKAYHEPPGNRDIITDGRPANFPKYAGDHPAAGPGYGATSEPPSTQKDLRGRPVSYPDHGNGEWVLISTTKGYQYPKRRHGQRAITFTPATATSHQTVKLTVLPMKNAHDMTTSHNGLIEVSSSTQTVEDAVQQQQQQQKATKTKIKHKRQQRPTTPASSSAIPKRKKQPPATYSLMRRDAAQDSSAVLAAVGAGMVPATMAILAPMVLGKKKK